jgi:hypothetical protein
LITIIVKKGPMVFALMFIAIGRLSLPLGLVMFLFVKFSV